MANGSIVLSPTLGIVLAALVVLGALVLWLGKLGPWQAVVVAALRAAVQLTVVSVLITAILRSASWTALFVLLMFTVAVVTSARRVRVPLPAVPWVAVAIGAGVAPVLALVLGTGVTPPRPVAIVPIAGIVIGGAMTATSQAARRALDELRTRHGEYEAALALGLTPRTAALEICRPSAGHALIPALDQTRTVGLVTLPGAYVGVLLGGASPIQAGVTQILVLIGLLAAESVAVLVTVEIIAAGLISRG